MAFFPANFMLQTSTNEYDNNSNNNNNNQPPNSMSPILPPCPPQDFHGVPSFLGKRSMSFSGIDNCCEDANGEEDLSDDGSQVGERKRRLNMEQVKTLEKNFELGNKLEPERKMQLARALGLQPRQIAIWFQNRRARWKTKQLEKDYDVLKRQFEAIKAENDSLQSQNLKLQSEILALKNGEPTESINLNKETIDQGSCSNRSENSSDIQLDLSRTSAIDSPLSTHPTSIPLFPTSSSSVRSPPPGMAAAQLFQNHHHQSSRPADQFHPQKIDQHHHHPVKEESFCNMFCGIEDQSGLWPWLEQHTQFN